MRKPTKLIGAGIWIIWFLLTMVAICALSWIVICGIIKLITMCFGLTFSWGVATGVWLIYILLKGLFSDNTTVKNK